MQVRHVGIVCKNLQKSLHFYEELFGCKISRRMIESGPFISTILGQQNIEVETVKLSCPQGETEIELLFFANNLNENSTSLFSYGLTHIALRVNDIDNLYAKMVAAKIPSLSKPEISVDGGAKVFFCRDPNGVFLEIVELFNK